LGIPVYEDLAIKEIYVDSNLLEPEFYIQILVHPVGKMWIIQEPKKIALWN